MEHRRAGFCTGLFQEFALKLQLSSALKRYLDSELKLGMFLESLLGISHKEKQSHLSEWTLTVVSQRYYHLDNALDA